MHEGMFFKICPQCAESEDDVLYEEFEKSLMEMIDEKEVPSANLPVEQSDSKNVPLG